MTAGLRRLVPVAIVGATLGCASAGARLPAGPGAPLPGFEAFHREATASCTTVRSLSLAMRLSGRSAGQRLRGTIHAGLAGPGSIRLEALAPFGGPVFVLAATPGASMLLLTREGRVLTGAEPAAVVEAVTGLRLTPDDLLGILAGCATRATRATGGRMYGDRWRRVDVDDGTALYFRRQQDRWALVAGVREALRVDYDARPGSTPRSVRLRTGGSGTVAVDLLLTITEVEMNVALGPEVFAVDAAPSATPMTLEELRQRGPLGESEAARP